MIVLRSYVQGFNVVVGAYILHCITYLLDHHLCIIEYVLMIYLTNSCSFYYLDSSKPCSLWCQSIRIQLVLWPMIDLDFTSQGCNNKLSLFWYFLTLTRFFNRRIWNLSEVSILMYLFLFYLLDIFCVSTENLVENLLGDFEFELQVPYLLYRNEAQEVNGIWFFNPKECEDVANLFTRYSFLFGSQTCRTF